MRSKKLVALSLAWHTLRSSCCQPDVCTVERLRCFEYPVQYIHVIQRFAGDFFAVSNRKNVSSWGWYLAGGIIDMIFGFYLIAYPLLSMEVIPFIIAFWLMFRGFSSVGYAMDLKRYGTRDWGWYIAFGILAVICSLIILWQPAIGALYAVYMISFAFLIIGFFRIMLSFELKSLHKRGKSMKEKNEDKEIPVG